MSNFSEQPHPFDIRLRIGQPNPAWRERWHPDAAVLRRLSRRIFHRLTSCPIGEISRWYVDNDEIPEWFEHADDLEAVLRDRWFAIPADDPEALRQFWGEASNISTRGANQATGERMLAEGTDFARALLSGGLIGRPEGVESVLIPILEDPSSDPKLVQNTALALSDSDAATDAVIDCLKRMPDLEASSFGWNLTATKNPALLRAIQQEARKRLKRLRFRRKEDFGLIKNWLQALISLVRNSRGAVEPAVDEAARKLIRATLKKASRDQFERFSKWTIRDLANHCPAEAVNILEWALEKFGWKGAGTGLPVLQGLIRADPRFAEIPLKGLRDWPDEKSLRPFLHSLDQMCLDADARYEVDRKLLRRLEKSDNRADQFAIHGFLISHATPRYRREVFDFFGGDTSWFHGRVTRFAWITWGISAEHFWQGLKSLDLIPGDAPCPDFGEWKSQWFSTGSEKFYDFWEALEKAGIAFVEFSDTDMIPPPYPDLLRKMRRMARGHFEIDRIRCRWRERGQSTYDGHFEISFILEDRFICFDIQNTRDNLMPEDFLRGVNGALAANGQSERFIRWTGETPYTACVFGMPDRWAEMATLFYMRFEFSTAEGATIELQSHEALLKSISERNMEQTD